MGQGWMATRKIEVREGLSTQKKMSGTLTKHESEQDGLPAAEEAQDHLEGVGLALGSTSSTSHPSPGNVEFTSREDPVGLGALGGVGEEEERRESDGKRDDSVDDCEEEMGSATLHPRE